MLQADRATVGQLIMAWEDTRENRPIESEAVAILNDVEHSVPSSSIEALNCYSIRPMPWSSREDHLDVLGRMPCEQAERFFSMFTSAPVYLQAL